MGLPLVLLESNGLPFLKALDLETGEVRLVGSPADELSPKVRFYLKMDVFGQARQA